MELFALNHVVAALEATLASLEGTARLDGLIELAWQLRQRDCRRSLQLADEAEALLSRATIADAERQRGSARLRLVRGEVSCLVAELDAAEDHANAAIAAFERLGDRIGAGDGRWLLTSIWLDRGNIKRRDECLTLAIEDFRAGGDSVRVDAGTARCLLYAGFGDARVTAARLAQLFDPATQYHASVTAWLAGVRSVVTSHAGDPGAAIRHSFEAHRASLESGQVRIAIILASNAADAFATLGDLEAALEWAERSLTMARSTGWPGMLGICLMRTGYILRLLHRNTEAKATLSEALLVLKRLTGSQHYAFALQNLGDLSLDIGDPAAALDYFSQAEEIAKALGEPIFALRCWRGQANALCRLAQPDQAQAKILAALTKAKQEGSADEQIKVLRVYAELYQRYALPPPEGMTAPSAALHYLHQIAPIAATIKDYTLPGEVLDEVASAYAASGDFRLAYANAQAAAGARDSKRLEDARNRAIAMQVRHETESAHTEAEHQRQLAQTEAQRAAALQEASVTLETLGLIGREITASLDAGAVYATLYRHVNNLLDATSFYIYLLEPGGQALSGAFGMEAGHALPCTRIPIDAPTSFAARCAREQREIVIDVEPEAAAPNLIPGTLHTVSLLFAPLRIGERLLGVMSVQSIRANAYGERERSIFRTLCAYGAIALDNAGAYALAEGARREADHALVELREAQVRLVQSETMASLGALVAGVAHEINTPLGVCVTAASHLEEELLLALREQEKGPLSAAGLKEFFEVAGDTVRILSSNTRRAAKLVHAFKQVSVDQASGEMRSVNLAEYLNEVLATLGPSLKNRPVSVNIACPPMLRVTTYPGALAQVITNLVMNSVIHGFRDRGRGVIDISASRDGDGVRLQYADDGLGMAPDALKKLFDPFYTTTRGTGGSGLGAHIVYKLITGPLAGRVEVGSTPGHGLHYDIRMPADLGERYSA